MAIKLKSVMAYASEKRFGGIHLEASGDLRVSYPVINDVTRDVDLIIRPWAGEYKCWLIMQPENSCSPQIIYDGHGSARQMYTDPRHAVDDTLRMLGMLQMSEGV